MSVPHFPYVWSLVLTHLALDLSSDRLAFFSLSFLSFLSFSFFILAFFWLSDFLDCFFTFWWESKEGVLTISDDLQTLEEL